MAHTTSLLLPPCLAQLHLRVMLLALRAAYSPAYRGKPLELRVAARRYALDAPLVVNASMSASELLIRGTKYKGTMYKASC